VGEHSLFILVGANGLPVMERSALAVGKLEPATSHRRWETAIRSEQGVIE
jgi:hypothetical protein